MATGESSAQQGAATGQPGVEQPSAMPDSGGVLVAVDGSEPGARALEWAVREAQQRGTTLTIAHAFYWPPSGFGAAPVTGFLMDALEQDSIEIVNEAGRTARSRAPDLTIFTESRIGPPMVVLVELSRGRELAVIGSRGLGGFAGLLLGSVGTGLVANAACSVAVIRGERKPTLDDPVVVGIDGSDTAETVLTQAFQAAERRTCPLVAVHCWQDPTTDLLTGQRHQVVSFDRKAWERSASAALVERVAATGQRFGSVRAEAVVDWGHPAKALLEHAARAQLLMVGTRGRRELAGMLLGSTSRAMVQHAACPVIVVRTLAD